MSGGPVTRKVSAGVAVASMALSTLAFSSRGNSRESDLTDQAEPHSALLDSLPRDSTSINFEPSALLSAIQPGNSVRLNETSARVYAVQEVLFSLGFRDDPPNSIFDSGTKNQVERFQRQEGLTVDGIVGPATAARMIEKPPRVTQPVIHVVKSGETLSSIAQSYHGRTAVWRDIAEQNNITDPSRLRVGQRINVSLANTPGATAIVQNNVETRAVPREAFDLTFEAEGNNNRNSIYFSRKLHWPGGASGVTIGRGYDMKERSSEAIRRDLIAAGLDSESARKLSAGAGLAGRTAAAFAERNGIIEISPEVEINLFEISWREAERDVIRISNRAVNVLRYGAVDWDRTDPSIKALAVDFRFRGDYTIVSRRILQEAIANNDKQKLLEVISNRSAWPNVPPDRFNRRMAFAKEVL